MKKNDLIDLRNDVAGVLRAIDAVEKTEAFWGAHEGEIPANIREIGLLRMRLFALSQTISRARRLPDTSDLVKRPKGGGKSFRPMKIG